ncbi:MAG: hypothetical protein FuToV8_gp1 [Hangzhou totivirus 8]|nr:MAG: hypothetical protein FuToV8_gp1 [Hangzhou totivirus 8]
MSYTSNIYPTQCTVATPKRLADCSNLPHYRRGNAQLGVAQSVSAQSSTTPTPVYRPTTVINDRPRTTILSALSRIFMPDIPSQVTKSLETVSLTPTEYGWEFVEIADTHFEDVSLAHDYVFTPEQKMGFLALIDLAKVYQPSIVTGVPFTMANEAYEHGNLVSCEMPKNNVHLATPVFTPAENWKDYSWSGDMILTLKYLPRERKWSSPISLAPGRYSITIDVQYDGSQPVVIDLVDSKKAASLGSMFIETLEPLRGYTVRIVISEAATLVAQVSEHMRSTINVLFKISQASNQTVLGRTEPIWVTDHKILQSTAYVKDLTTEGIESNPGPMIIDSWMARAKLDSAWKINLLAMDHISGNRFSILSTLDQKDIEYTPDIRECLVAASELKDKEQKPKTPIKPRAKVLGERGNDSSPGGGGGGSDKERKHQVAKDEAMTSRQAAFKRIATKLMVDIDYQVRFVARINLIPPSTIRYIARLAWGLDWEEAPSMSPCQFALFCWLNKITTGEFVSTIVDNAKYTKDKAEALRQAIIDLDSTGYVEAAARAHNKIVHSLNGNIFTHTMADLDKSPNFWTMVNTPPAARPDEPMATKNIIFAGIASNNAQNRKSTEVNGFTADVIDSAGINLGPMSISYPCSGLQLYQTYAGLINASHNHYALEMKPRAKGISILRSRCGSYWVNTLRPTPFSSLISNQIAQQGYYKTRESDMAQTGFSVEDIIAVNALLEPQGFSFERQLLALLMIHSYKRYSEIENIPLSAFTNGSDFIKPGDSNQISFRQSYSKDVDIDNEYEVFPFSGVEGSLAVHLSLETVPMARRANAVFVPTFITAASSDSSKFLALFIMSLSEWPFSISAWVSDEPRETEDSRWRIPFQEKDEDFAWQSEFLKSTCSHMIQWILNHSTVNIPGLTDIDIILPRKHSSRVPRSQAEADNTAEFRPRNADHHNTAIPINYQGAPFQSVALVDYLLNWLPKISPGDVAVFIATLDNYYNVSQSINAVWDIMVATVYRFPVLLNNQKPPVAFWGSRYNMEECWDTFSEQRPDDREETPHTSVGASDSAETPNEPSETPATSSFIARLSQTTTTSSRIASTSDAEPIDRYAFADIIHTPACDLVTPTLLTTHWASLADIPTKDGYVKAYGNVPDSSSLVISDFNPRAWNKIVLNLATSDEFKVGGSNPIIPYLNDPLSIHGEIHRAIRMAVPVQLFCQEVGAGSTYYVDTRAKSQYPDLRDTILATFVGESVPRLWVSPQALPILNSVHRAIYHTNIAEAAIGGRDGGSLVSIYGRWMYSSYASVWIDKRVQDKVVPTNDPPAASKADIFTPAILADIWLQLFANTLPKAAMSMPIPFGFNGPAGFSSGMELTCFSNGEVSPRSNPDINKACFPTDCLPAMADEARWNLRLMVMSKLGLYKWRTMDGHNYEGRYDNNRLPSQIKSAPAPRTDYNTPWPYIASSTCLPFLDENGYRVYASAKQRDMVDISRAEIGALRLSLPVWVVGNVTLHNPNITDDSGKVSRFAQVFRQPASAAEPASAPAVEPAAIPQLTHQLEQMVNPASAITTQASTDNPPVVSN